MNKSLFGDITTLALDHPGAQDLNYRARRNQIAEAARAYAIDPSMIPMIEYTAEEHTTWNVVTTTLRPLHEAHASALHLAAQSHLRISTNKIPQLRSLSASIERAHGFTLAPTEGLIDPRLFLTALGRRVMFCTQYIRHASKPEYTPEPDIIHEVIGHVPAFLDRDMADFSHTIGTLAARASNKEFIELERLYWYTIEFGLIREEGKTKAFGAGFLSSIGELAHAMSHPEIAKPFRIQEVTKTPYAFSAMQTTLFIMPSFAEVQKQTTLHYKHLLIN